MSQPGDDRAESEAPGEIDALADEFLLRHRRGEQPSVEEYAQRKPHLAAEIRELFPTLGLIEDFGKSSSPRRERGPLTVRSPRTAETRDADPCPLRQIGEYRIVREIGRGGMGIVYEAEQESLSRRVAIKVLPFHSLLGAKHLARFLQEAKAAARLNHPNIVPVFSVGEHLGLHYFVMKYVPGQGLDAVIADVRRLRKAGKEAESEGMASSLGSGGRNSYYRNVARIARDAALALDHAHKEGVLHRDVKPSNLLLEPTGHVWLADFGLAKCEESDDLTRSGDLVGTLRYMAPEQLKGWSDPRSDVYSLGLTLYELLTLRPAFRESDRARLLRKVASEEPPAPRRVERGIPRDLETIVGKASAKEASQRYGSALALAKDLDSYLGGKPVEARRSTPIERVARWCMRNPLLAGLEIVVALLLLVVAVIASYSAARLAQERDLGREKLRASYFSQAQLLQASAQPGQRVGALAALVEASRIAPGADLCDVAVSALALEDARTVKVWERPGVGVPGVDVDRRRIAISDRKGATVIRSLDNDEELLQLPGPGYDVPFVQSLFHPDGRHLAVRLHKDNTFSRWAIWNLDRREVVARADNGGWDGGIAIDPQDGSFVLGLQKGLVRTIEIPSGRTLREERYPAEVSRLAIHPGGLLMAIRLGNSTSVQLVDRRSGRTLRACPHPGRPNYFVWDPRGRFLAVACHDYKTYLWEAETGQLRWAQGGHEAEVYFAAFHPRGDYFLTGGWDNQVHAWDPWTGRRLFDLSRQFVHLSRDGRWLATWSGTGHDLVELAPAPTAFTLHGHEKPNDKQPAMIALAPAGRLAASCGTDGIRLWDLASRGQVAHVPAGNVLSVEFEPGGNHLITSGQHGVLRWPILTSVAGGRRRLVLGPPAPLSPVEDTWRHSSFDGGRKVAVIHQRTHIHVSGPQASAEEVVLRGGWPLEHLASSPDGRWIAGTSKTLGTVLLWEGSSGKKERELGSQFGLLAFDPRSRYLVVGTPVEYLFHRTSDWSVARRIPRSSGLSAPGPVGFDRQGEVLALARTDSRIWLVELESGRRLAELEAPDPRTLNGLALDLDSGFLAASTRSQRCHFWDLRATEIQLASAGLPWELHCRGEGPGREPLQVDSLVGAAIPGLDEDYADPLHPPLFRRFHQVLLRPQLESHAAIDLALAAPELLVPEGSSWRYFRGTLEPSPGLTWAEPTLDDSSWPQGHGGFHGRRSTDDETGTVLEDQVGSFTTLYLRHSFQVEDPGRLEDLLLAVRYEDGFIAYLNGREVARQNAGRPGEPLSHEGLAGPAAAGPRRDFLARIDRGLLARGKNLLAVQGLAHHRSSSIFLLPVLAAVLTPDEATDRDRTRALPRGPDGAPDLALSAYRSGRLHQRAGALDQALAEYAQAAGLDPASPEPIARALECRRRLGQLEAAEVQARLALEKGGLLDDGALWAHWAHLALGEPRRPLAQVLQNWPAGQAAASPHGASLRASVEDLAERGAVRINCGGPRLEDRMGLTWSADRWYLGGLGSHREPAADRGLAGAWLQQAPLYGDQRVFAEDRHLLPAYRVPVPSGRYTVKLHFAAAGSAAPGGITLGIRIERRVLQEGYEVPQAIFAPADVRSFEVAVNDGSLDLEFLAERGQPALAALEIEPAR